MDQLTKPLKEYTVDINDPPSTRWVHIVNDHKPAIHKAYIWIKNNYNLNALLTTILNTVASTAKPYTMYSDEIQAIADQCNISYGVLLLMQLTYELSACCTSIIAKDNENNIHHIRTMDWGLDFLSQLTISVKFVNKSKELFKCITWAGYVGVLTGVSNNASIAINFRNSKNGNIMDNIKKLATGAWPIGFLVRNMFENQYTYKQVVEIASTAQLVAPTYFSISNCAKPEGCVITRSRSKIIKKRTLENRNYIVQTNIDDINSENNILDSKARIRVAKKYLENKEINKELLWKLMSKKPINNSITIYTCYMSDGDIECRTKIE